ncbi:MULTISPECIES: PPE family protein [Mycobacterium]|uniref:PPE family protein n=1 Tax=Mycobacterium kiyosense TaxID=2871094 RepID=A0A9P3UV19_9MYCO|nr:MULTISPECIES: PPE family protein [Mycobacterium]BDE14130.1 PPE family protein [Mycobacterium sp. 20KCMC460]GLB82963.1 PPE family protein [Mycobacterium kiyosense]GLB89196.1 PPE family protein [Mycobacterium kiyosense]GLB93847.1 PPE family protein [Mycobacterium kiyosense]GLC00013.1 PPE family protein [Mycobacterium kiyosense]
MATDFSLLPPEVTSALMYSGPGASSFVAAASAWNALATELTSTAQGYEAVLDQLAGEEWLGPASSTMVQAALPYVSWLTTTASSAESAAAQSQAVAAAFETAFASIVPPPLVAANRAALAQAVQTNLLGLNNGVIAQLEAQYADMWAQNSATMLNYATASQAASKLTTFTEAPTIVNPGGAASQATAVAAAQAAPAASIQESLQSFFNQVTAQLGALGTPASTTSLVNSIGTSNPILTELWFLLTGQTTLPTSLGNFLNGLQPYASFFYNTEGLPYFSVGMGNSGVQIAKSAGLLTSAAPAAAAVPTPPISAAIGGAGGQVAAGLGNGAHIGHLAVPASWPGASAAPTVRPAVQMVSEPIVTGASAGGNGNVLSGMPVFGAGNGRGVGAGPRYGFKPTVMPRPMSAG